MFQAFKYMLHMKVCGNLYTISTNVPFTPHAGKSK